MFEVYLPGTGGMKPLPDRALTGLWIEHDGTAILIDCGEGMQVSLSRCKRSLARLDTLLITHFHADHVAGLPGLLLSAGNFGKVSPLHIYAPKGVEYILGGLMRICPELPFETIIHELSECGGKLDINGIETEYMPVRHRVPCFCYRFTEKRPPVFSPEKAKELGVPISMWKKLHSGNNIEVDGKIISTEMVSCGVRKPLRVTYITDTVYFDGLTEFASNSDLLICEGMYGDDEYIDKMTEKGHMVFSQGAKLASQSHSSELWLTHYSPALTEPESYADMMKKLFENTVISCDGMYKTIKGDI